MFNKTIFKQTLKQNWKLWLILTALMALMVSAMIATFDPVRIQMAAEAFGDTAGMGGPGGRGGGGGGDVTLVGMIGNGFFGMWGLVIPLIYVIVTAISLIVSKVDRGSMAYTLSTPIKRLKVIGTQAIYLMGSTFAMFLVVTIVGLGVVQLAHGALTADEHTPDMVAAAEVLGISPGELASTIPLMLENPEAITAGANARDIPEDVYTLYLAMRMMNYLTDGLYSITGMTIAELQANPEEILENQEVIDFIAGVFGFSQEEIDAMLADAANGYDDYAYDEYAEDYEEVPAATQEMLMIGLTAAADYLGMGTVDLMAEIRIVRENPNALAVAVSESGATEEEVVNFVNQLWASNELALDEGMQFSLADFISLNLGAFLLMFAIGGITFLASSVFNLSKNALIIGAGLPVGFLILEMLSQISEDFERLRYLTLNTLFDPSVISNGGTFIPQFIALAVIGLVLYVLGIKSFNDKDLPL